MQAESASRAARRRGALSDSLLDVRNVSVNESLP
jgi:hypothetical protein